MVSAVLSMFLLLPAHAETEGAKDPDASCAQQAYVPPIDERTREILAMSQQPHGFTIAKTRMSVRSKVLRTLVLNVPKGHRTFANTIDVMNHAFDMLNSYDAVAGSVYSLGAKPIDKAQNKERIAAFEAFDRTLAQESNAWRLDPKLRQAVIDTPVTNDREAETRAVLLQMYKDAGAHLPKKARERLAAINLELTQVRNEARLPFEDEHRVIEIGVDQSPGLPAAFVQRYAADGKTLRLPANAGSVIREYLRAVTNSESLRFVYEAFRSRMPDNGERFLTLMRLQRENADILKFKSLVDQRINSRTVSGSVDDVKSLLGNLEDALRPRIEDRIQEIAAAKIAAGDLGEMGMWDWFRHEEKNAQGQSHALSFNPLDFFHPETVGPNLLKYYERVGRIGFTELHVPEMWHPDVIVLLVRDLKNAGAPLGHIVLDLYKRDGKSPGVAYVTPLNSYAPARDGQPERLPTILAVFNWDPPLAGQRSKPLAIDEVGTYLHEWGHLLNALLTHADSPAQGAFSHSMDFIESPSTASDLTIKNPRVLQALSGHVDDPSRKLTLEQAEELARPDAFALTSGKLFHNQQLHNRVFLAQLDIAIQEQLEELKTRDDLHRLYRREFKRFYQSDPGPNDAYAETFLHLYGGYAGDFSSYLRATWIAANLNERLEELGGVDDPAAFAKYRVEVLSAQVTSKSIRDRIERFLGRPLRVPPLLRVLNLE